MFRAAVRAACAVEVLRAFQDLLQNANTGVEIARRDLREKLGTKTASGFENRLQHARGARLQMNGLAAAIAAAILPADPAILLQTTQRAGECRLFDTDAGGDFALSQFVGSAGEMDESDPFALAEAERLEAMIEAGAPASGDMREKEAEALG